MSQRRVLVVEDDTNLRRVMEAQIELVGCKVSGAGDVPEALAILRDESQDLVISDLNLPGESGLDLLKAVRAAYPETTFVIVTAYGSVSTAVDAMKAGAHDYLTKPVHPYELRALVSRILERCTLIEEVRALRSGVDRKFGFESIIGQSNSLLRVLDAAAHVASSDATILIHGETGTGKEVLAKAIHFNSPRRNRPFVVINCGSIPRELLESELFGHVRGAFTGALSHKKGKVEMAEGGTVFLDEIGEMPLELQVRILRLIQEREIEKVGAGTQTKVDVRIVAATHRNLQKLIEDGTFREDLYYRLAVVPLELPPLRDRREDIPEFVHRFFEKNKHKAGNDDLRFPSMLMPYFLNYHWPGNVRELENVIARIVLLARQNEITVEDLPIFLRSIHVPSEVPAPALPRPAEGRSLDEMERDMILGALRKFGGNQSKAARSLSITRKVLLNRMVKHNITKEELQPRPAASDKPVNG